MTSNDMGVDPGRSAFWAALREGFPGIYRSATSIGDVLRRLRKERARLEALSFYAYRRQRRWERQESGGISRGSVPERNQRWRACVCLIEAATTLMGARRTECRTAYAMALAPSAAFMPERRSVE